MPVEPPGGLSPIIGDCVNNLRSALDQAVSALARQAGLRDNWSYFPTRSSSRGWPPQGFSNLPAAALAVIERFQPYHDAQPDHNLLYLLNALWNQDKHRDIVLTGTCLRSATHRSTPPGQIPMMTLGIIRDGDVILRLPLAGTVEFESDFAFAVAFGQGSPAAIDGASVTYILGLMLDYVLNTVMPSIEGLFP